MTVNKSHAVRAELRTPSSINSGFLQRKSVKIPAGVHILEGILNVPLHPKGLVILAHGGGSPRYRAINKYVASVMHSHHLATLRAALLTKEEAELDRKTRAFRHDVSLLTKRYSDIINYTRNFEFLSTLKMGYFSSSTAASAALISAVRHASSVNSVVSCGGRIDLASDFWSRVTVPALLIVGERDAQILHSHNGAMSKLNSNSQLRIIPGATHLFEETGALQSVAQQATSWLLKHMV